MKSLRVLCVLFGLIPSGLALNREAFTISKYDLNLQLEPAQHRLGARGRITLRNDSSQPQKIAVLQISSSLAWRSIKIAGKPVQFVSQPYVSDIDHTAALAEAIVTLPAEIKPKEAVEIEIGYEGTVGVDATRLTQIGVPDDIARHTSWDQISPAFTAVRGAGYVAWYPIATEAADFSEGNSMFQVADRWRAREAEAEMALHFCAAGSTSPPVLMGDKAPSVRRQSRAATDHPASSQSCSEYRFEPLGSVTPLFVMADYRHDTADNSPNSGIYFLADHAAGARIFSQSIKDAIPFVTAWFGAPAGATIVADLRDARGAPFESGVLLLVPLAAPDESLTALNAVHQQVHAAFSSPRPWIQEGLAHFAEALYREQVQDGRSSAIDFLHVHRTAFVDAEQDVAAGKSPGQPLATTYDESYYRSKAACVWWMLRDMIGDEALKGVIHAYRAAEDKDSRYVEQLVSAAAQRDLGWFFDDWVYHDRGLPDLRVAAAHSQKTGRDTEIVAVTIANQGNTGAEVPFTVRFATGEVTRRIEVRAQSTATTRVEVPGTPTEVVVNDGSVPESDLTNNVLKVSEP